MSRASLGRLIAVGVLVCGACSARAQDLSEAARLSVLEAKLSSLEAEMTLLEDLQAIKRLQSAYGYYASKGMADELADLFADDPRVTLEIGGRGAYVGRERIRQFFRHESNRLREGEIFNHVMGQEVIHIADDGKTAKGRVRSLVQAGRYGGDGRWIEGPFENEYVKEDGVWKFSKVHWYITVNASYADGWHKKSHPLEGPLEDLPPDLPPSDDFEAYPAAYFKPFHYLHPVTGKPVVFRLEDER